MVNVSRTVGNDQMVEELGISFTHATPIGLAAARRRATRCRAGAAPRPRSKAHRMPLSTLLFRGPPEQTVKFTAKAPI